jgi:amidohydrolase
MDDVSGDSIVGRFTAMHPGLTALRRELHAQPELGFREVRTAHRVATWLQALRLEVHTGLATTGVVGVMRGQLPDNGRRVGLRADMDAIPIGEETGLQYRSMVSGCMHGCGHDGHMAILLGTASYLAAHRDFAGTVVFIFQPGEEGHAGARRMIEDGLFDRFPVDAVFALHNWPSLPEGVVGLNRGPMMAAIDRFEIDIRGKGGHGAHPHQTIDPILVGSQVVQALHTIVSRSVNPVKSAVLSLQSFQSGSPDALSVIPEGASLAGMVKWFDPVVGATVEKRIREVSQGVASAHQATAVVDYQPLYPPTINTPDEAQLVMRVAQRVLGESRVETELPPSMGSEDFAFMLQARPGAYFRLGQGTQRPFLHSPIYDFNDATIPAGSAVLAEIAREYLGA